jgi:hypothetical protein
MRSRVSRNLSTILAGSPRESRNFAKGLLAHAAPAAEEDAEKPSLPPGFTGHDYATLLLHIGAEVEHALLVEYLFAAYSLGGPQVPEEHRETVQKWQTVLLGIAKEEMAHFVTVQNVLRLIGSPLNLEREDFPWDVEFAPFKFTLEKLSRESLARYVYIEAPEPDAWPDDAKHDQEEIIRLAKTGGIEVNQVGKLYREMIRVLSDSALVPESAFQSATMPYQASWDEWGRGYRDGARGGAEPGANTPDLIIAKAYSRGSAVAALEAVAEQGEAADTDAATGEQSHFRRFFDIWKHYPTEADGWSPVRDLAVNPTTVEHLPGTGYIADDRVRDWGHLLNLRYRMLLTYLAHSFRLSGADTANPAAEARGFVLHATFGEMYNLRVISNLLVAKPLGDGSGAHAGPPFEMPYSMELPPREADAWRLHIELVDGSLALIKTIECSAEPGERAYLETLRAVDERRRAALCEIVAGAGGHRTRLGGWS